MKKIVIITMLFTSTLFFAQGQKTLDVTIGYEDDGLFGNIGLSYFTEMERFWRVGLNMHIENFSNSPDEVDVQLYTGQIEHYRQIASFYNNGTTIYLGGGLIGGYENINNGEEFLPNGAKINAESQFIYGGTAGIELAQYLFGEQYHSNLKLVVNAGYNYYINSDVGNIQPRVRAGIKYQF